MEAERRNSKLFVSMEATDFGPGVFGELLCRGHRCERASSAPQAEFSSNGLGLRLSVCSVRLGLKLALNP